jgi:siroheme synthase
MPGRNLELLAEEWLQQGLPPEFPCAVVSNVAQAGQQIHYTTLGSLGALAPVPAPSLLLAGWSVGAGAHAARLAGDAALARG